MISNRDDPHAVLGVARTATPAQISHAYRELLRRHHPDTRNTEDEDAHDLALREVLNAYSNLHRRNHRDVNDRDQPIRPHQPADNQHATHRGPGSGRPTHHDRPDLDRRTRRRNCPPNSAPPVDRIPGGAADNAR